MNKTFIKIVNICSIILILIIVFFLIKMLGNSFIYKDDWYPLNYTGFNDFILHPENGCYISSLFNYLFEFYLPSAINIHPSDFKSVYFPFIQIMIISLFPLLFYKIFLLNAQKRLKILTPSIFLFMYVVFLVIVCRYEYFFFVYDTLFRMALPVSYWMILFYFLLKNNRKKTENIIIYISGFLCCFSSNEMIAASSFIGVFIYFIIQLFNKKSDEIEKLIRLLITMFIGFSLYILIGGFLRHSNGEIINYSFFISILKEIPEFSICYFKEIIIRHIIPFVSISLCILALYFKMPKDETKNNKIILCLSFLIGILIFFYSLIFLKKSHYSPDKYWLIHWDLHYMFNIMLFSINLVLTNLIIKFKKIKPNFILICMIILIVFLGYKYHCKYIFFNEMIKERRIEMYKTEKSTRLACLLNKPAIVNFKLFNSENISAFINTKPENKKEPDDITRIYFVEFFNRFDTQNQLTGQYILSDNETCEKIFKENGGYYTDKELKELKFTNLLNNNFILGTIKINN